MNKSKMRVIIEPAIINTYLYKSILDGICKRADRKGLEVTYTDMLKLQSMSDENACLATPVIIISTSVKWLDQIHGQLNSLGLKCILLVINEQKLKRNTSIITLSLEDLTYDIVQYMVYYERRKIAFFAYNPKALTDRLKLAGYKKASEIFNLSIKKNDIYYNHDSISTCLINFFNRISEYNGVICANDFSAIALINNASSHGVEIPKDLYVVGFGDTMIGRYIEPSLTSVTLDYFKAGCYAVDNYIYLLKNPDIYSQFTTIKCQINARTSTENRKNPANCVYRIIRTAVPEVSGH